ncbi:c-type cytochrome [Noviherbaspirillum autotrophicum]|uniref:Cytochrome C n=1 Tax=Noviherbaspirillum autotrophicum TaxID=709839 RepID=A0A0C1YM33_9BURK|nr:c-type cytochrome [Noviherbaspirillum autotrophicum]KIF81557.1 cytochrome C [Noviherbaspirillum autotrophicum]
MSGSEQLFSLKNPWFVGSVAAVAGTALVAALVGFVWMPYAQNDKSIGGLWDAICRAAGAPGPAAAPADVGSGRVHSSDVIVVPQMISEDRISVGRGATLALRCTMCHGARGMSGANTPNLAGQNAESVYKQLRDFQSGHRISEIMAPHVRNLSDQDMRDLAAYYADLPRLAPPPTLVEQLRAPVIVQIGSPMRNIPPCVSCHGGSDRKTASPTLDGEPAQYLHTQLAAFANGTRHNDIHGQMRNVVRQMTPEEIKAVVDYYSRR